MYICILIVTDGRFMTQLKAAAIVSRITVMTFCQDFFSEEYVFII